MSEQQFDVFLAHSSKDKPLIRQIYGELKARGIQPWLDEEEIAPGTSFQDEIQEAIDQIKTAAICIGQEGLGRWQALELKTFISQCVESAIPVIPVLLPGVEGIPENLLFLKQFHAVSFKSEIEDEQAFDQLEWGITRRKPQPKALQLKSRPEDQPIPSPIISLQSEKGVDYRKLRDLLEAQDWKAADYETYLRMLEVVGRNERDYIRPGELRNFPCADLKTLDELWVHYSRGRFGFSVQKKIYLECGGKPDGEYPGDKIWGRFGDRVGWRDGNWIVYGEMTFSTQAPSGHLPGFSFHIGGLRYEAAILFFRIETCKV
jgi:hypothetical protein